MGTNIAQTLYRKWKILEHPALNGWMSPPNPPNPLGPRESHRRVGKNVRTQGDGGHQERKALWIDKAHMNSEGPGEDAWGPNRPAWGPLSVHHGLVYMGFQIMGMNRSVPSVVFSLSSADVLVFVLSYYILLFKKEILNADSGGEYQEFWISFCGFCFAETWQTFSGSAGNQQKSEFLKYFFVGILNFLKYEDLDPLMTKKHPVTEVCK